MLICRKGAEMQGLGTKCKYLRDEMQGGKAILLNSGCLGIMFTEQLTEFTHLLAANRNPKIKAFYFKGVGG